MKIFTKSLLTLVLLCVAGVVSADRSWQKVAFKAYVHEFRDGSSDQFDGEALTEDGAFKVYCRTPEEAGKESVDDWDSQFFIQWDSDKALFEGDKIKITMKVKADLATDLKSVGTQAHGNHGDYNFWDCIGSVAFTEEWTEFSAEKEVSSNMALGDGNKNGFWSIAFNLANTTSGSNNFYFKDIEVQLFSEKGITKTVVSSKVVVADSWISNGDIENENLASFPVSRNGGKKGDPYPEDERDTGAASFFPEIVEGEGIDGTTTHYLKVDNDIEPAETWGTQFFLYASEVMKKGTPYILEFDAKADMDANIPTGFHAAPRAWKAGGSAWDITSEWAHYTLSGTVPSTDDDILQSIAFDLNNTSDANGTSFYFDNFVFGPAKKIEQVENGELAIQILFTDYTNMPDLIYNNVGGKSRLELPDEVASQFKVTVDGAEVEIGSVEFDKQGMLYIFPEDEIAEDSEVKVSFVNSTDEKYRLVYTNGDNKDKAVENFELTSTWNEDVDAVPFKYGVPDIQSSEPEDKSFGLEGTLTQFTVVFDKATQCDKVEAKLDGVKLTVEYAEANGTTIVLKRSGSDALAEGEHTITIDRVYGATDLELIEKGTFTLTFSVGAKSMPEDLQFAITEAENELEASADDRYAGDAFNALTEAVNKYKAEGPTYTAPSQVKAATNELSSLTQALAKHRQNCVTFDECIMDAEKVVADAAAFAEHDLYKALKSSYDKYAGKQLTDDAELAAAVAEMKDNVAAGKLMFTSGPSSTGTTGIAALVERIRLGKEALLALGASEDDEIIVEANKAMTDDDALAKRIQEHLSLKVCEALKDGVDLFDLVDMTDDGPVYGNVDMSVFIKNPNLYKEGTGKSTVESVVGWTVPTSNKPGVHGSGGPNWGNPRNAVGLPEDCAFSAWRPNVMRMEQTVEGLPAGLYTVTMLATDWAHHNEGQSFAYAITYSGANAALAPDEGVEPDMDLNYSGVKLLEEAGNYQINKVHEVPAVEVIDGKLTIGVQFGQYPGAGVIQEMFADENLSTQDASTQYMFDAARLYLTGAKEGHDYAADYNQIITGVVSAKNAKVSAIEVYDLNGRRMVKATKGLNIVKRVMSDGSVQTSKVVK